MGDVYVAQDTKLDRRVALKILPPEFAADADRMRRFVLEARSASALNHPNIITIYEVGEIDGTNFIATEYIEGKTLNNCDSLSLLKSLEVATQIASALQAAHSAGIVHRDIKPDNVMIRPDGLVKILDFGIAKLSGVPMITGGPQVHADEEAATAMRSHTSTGMIIGTATYMSPEQARGKMIDARSDLFSFGVVLYELLTGRRPFVGENAMDVIGSIVADEPKPLKELLPGLPTEIDQIVRQALRKDREQRYQTAGDMLTDLKSVQRRLEFEAELERSEPQKRVGQTQLLPAPTTAQTGSYNSIAVLPFTNLSADPDNEYFCDGLAEELLGALTKIEHLRVAARSSTFSFKGRNINASEIGRILNVRAVLEGSVRKSGDRVRISLQLINAADGYQLWSERYDREMKDIFDVQDEITLAVVDALKLKLLVDEKEEVLKRYTKNAEAYQLYLRGRFFFLKRTREALLKAIEYFQQAIELDGDYALAYSGMADSYVFLGFYEHIPPAEAEKNLKSAALKSVEIDDTLAETRTSIAFYRSLYQWDFIEAGNEIQRAIALNPKYAFAHHVDSTIQILFGRYDDAIAAESCAIELDPFTAIFNATLGWWHYIAGRNDEAIAQSLRTIEFSPNHFFAHWILGLAYAQAGRLDEAAVSLEKGVTLTNGGQAIKAELGRILGQSGRREEAQKLLNELIDQGKKEYVSPVNLAKLYLGLNDVERTYEQLERAFAERSVRLQWFMLDPCLNHIRSEHRFQDLLRRIGLPHKEVVRENDAQTVIFDSVIRRNTVEQSNSTTSETAPSSVGSNNSRRWASFTIAGLAMALVIALIGFWFSSRNRLAGPVDSIAVLPFQNKSGDSDSDYLSDGLSESLIYRLSQLPNLKVSPTSLVFRYKGKEIDPIKVGIDLGVSAVLTGRITQRGDDLTISAELVDVRNSKLLWGEQYDRKASDLLATQREIAREIVDRLKLQVSTEEKGLVKHYTENNQAYELYLKGRFYWNKRTSEANLKAVEAFQQAIEKDPTFALAYSGLADSYILMGTQDAGGTLPPEDVLPKAKAAALKSIEIDSALAEPHVSLAHISYHYDLDREKAEREFKRAIELNPNYVLAHQWYSLYLAWGGRKEEALNEARRARDLDPLSLPANMVFGWVLLINLQETQAIEELRKTIELDPSFVLGHHRLGLAYEQHGDYSDAIAEFQKVNQLSGGKPIAIAELAYAYAVSGKLEEARKGLAELQRLSRSEYTSPAMNAAVYVALGDKDQAFVWLEKGFKEHDQFIPRLKYDPRFNSLHSDPRFQELLRRAGS